MKLKNFEREPKSSHLYLENNIGGNLKMSNNFFKNFPTTYPFPIGEFRAIVVDCRAEEITEGTVTIYLSLILIDLESGNIYTYCDTIVNHLQNPRSVEFFDFLSASYVCWEEYEDLKGLTFNCTVTFEQYGGTVLPILCKRKIVAKPHCK